MSWQVLLPYYFKGELRYKEYDIVWYTKDCDSEYVRTSLINHDNYPHNIIVKPL